MTTDAYFLRGINDEHLLVFRGNSSEDLLFIIRRLAACRDKQIKAMAKKLEEEWNQREYGTRGRDPSEAKPEAT
ncbi:hypothetical protein HUN41_00085 [Streptomyces phage Coruscant]|uniref:Uncharacterized protein n=1 Tax=Streptomyces phage Coruscant TaxID=2739834 RepID=A0A7G4AW24_9CAUD|nr:hypothetical protein PP454_gp203 [Streptomyces phage Coruscant]QMP84214.1 hypothetical protein HUN41_00085 [Streptomyces phage Coruscant]